MLKHFYQLVYLEYLLLLRNSQEWLYPLAFFCIIICLFPIAFAPDKNLLVQIIPGGIWIAALLASLLSIDMLFHADLEDGYLEQLLLSQQSFTMHINAKLLAHWLATQIPIILLAPFIGWIFNLSFVSNLMLSMTLILGTPILLLLNSLGLALTLGLRQQGMLLALLIFPLTLPVLIFGVNIILQIQNSLTIKGPLAFLAGLSILSLVFLPMAIATSLKFSIQD